MLAHFLKIFIVLFAYLCDTRYVCYTKQLAMSKVKKKKVRRHLTVRLPDHLHEMIKAKQERENSDRTTVVEEALEKGLKD